MMDITGIGAGLTAISDIVGKFLPDKTQAEKDQMTLMMAQMQGELAANQGQMGINQAEATSVNWWVSGWRPGIGWVCGSACAWNWVGLPLANFLTALFHRPLAMAPADLTQMLPILLGMLGMSAIRMGEKINGVAAK
jgi:roadblock/LC7 domain-containing protein